MPRIVYLSWPAHEITGGVKAIYQHVGLLLEAGLDAAAATVDGVPPPWFARSAPTLALDDVRADDVLVFPENNEELFARFAPSAQPKLVFCQNPFQVWRGLNDRASYADWGVSHVLCVSQTVMNFCRRRLPGAALAYAPFYIDHELFQPAPAKRLQIACVPRKRPQEAMAIRDLFRASHPRFAAIPWVMIDQATEQMMAQSLALSAVFLSLARFEAHGMTALEAMASGCVVAGYHGNPGGSDSAHAGNGFWAPGDDIVSCVAQLAEATQLAIDQGPACQLLIGRSRQTAHAYRRDESARLLLEAWRGLLPVLRR